VIRCRLQCFHLGAPKQRSWNLEDPFLPSTIDSFVLSFQNQNLSHHKATNIQLFQFFTFSTFSLSFKLHFPPKTNPCHCLHFRIQNPFATNKKGVLGFSLSATVLHCSTLHLPQQAVPLSLPFCFTLSLLLN